MKRTIRLGMQLNEAQFAIKAAIEAKKELPPFYYDNLEGMARLADDDCSIKTETDVLYVLNALPAETQVIMLFCSNTEAEKLMELSTAHPAYLRNEELFDDRYVLQFFSMS